MKDWDLATVVVLAALFMAVASLVLALLVVL